MQMLVVIIENLNTQQCADIFLSINTEQKVVPRSLVFDLYGVASEAVIDPAAVRARDIATFLNEDSQSPYNGEIKMPGAPTRKGGIALSTAVSSIKPLVEEKGSFEQIGVTELETQKQIFFNLFTALRNKYDKEWDKNTNAFMYAAGFVGAAEFLKLRLLPYCNSKEDFTVEEIDTVINLESDDLIYQTEVKGLGGKAAANHIYERLVSTFIPDQYGVKKFKI